MQVVNMLIKPSGLCNMRCRYCFYAELSAARTQTGDGMMQDETLDALVRGAFESAEERVVFGFQGGEPLMAGLDFFRRFIELEEKYKRRGIHIEHTIQTNGLLIDDDWAEFFRKHRFLVGLSLDGNRELHDSWRLDAAGGGTYSRVVDALACLRRRGVGTNILCVVTGQLARRAESVYNALKSSGCRYLQFIPCLDPIDAERGKQQYSLSPQRYAAFLKTLFDLWYRDWESGDYVSIRLFDDYVHMLCGRQPGSCASAGRCGQYLVVEHDGSVYPCDFYTADDWYLGNIRDTDAACIAACSRAAEFINIGAQQPQKCAGCEYARLCRGGCRRDRTLKAAGTENYYCTAFRSFFSYAIERLEYIAAMERHAIGGTQT